MSNPPRTTTRPAWMEYANFWITAANIVAVTLGSYFWLGRYQAASARADVELKQLNLQITKAQENLERLTKETTFTTDALKMIAQLQPHFDFEIGQSCTYKDRTLRIDFVSENHADFLAAVKPKIILITSSLIRSLSEANESNTLAKVEPSFATEIESKGRQGHTYDLDFAADPPKDLYYFAVYEVATDPRVAPLATKALHNLGIEAPDDLMRQTQNRYGPIALPSE